MVPPQFPLEVQKRIIHFTFSLTPSISTPEPGWDDRLSGQALRQSIVRRVVERLDAGRTALTLMRVCKTWKKEIVKYLYAEPHLTSFSLIPFLQTLISGHKKWSDLNLHIHSTPGRYLTTLDLSHLHDGGGGGIYAYTLDAVCETLFPLIPNLRALKLPVVGQGYVMRRLCQGESGGMKRLRALEGVVIGRDAGEEMWMAYVKGMKSLEVLHISGEGNVPDASEDESMEDMVMLDLKHLHTITFNGVKRGRLISTLSSSDLPALSRVLITSYHTADLDQTYAFQQSHGAKIRSLTYLHAREWPRNEFEPPADTLEIHPNLRHLGWGLPDNLDRLFTILQTARSVYPDHPIERITLPRWVSSRSDGSTAMTHSRLLRSLVERPLRCLKVVRIDGMRWVNVGLGHKAMTTGDQGEMRGWSERLKVVGVELRDVDGNLAPEIVEEMGMGSGLRRRRRSSVKAERIGLSFLAGQAESIDEDGA